MTWEPPPPDQDATPVPPVSGTEGGGGTTWEPVPGNEIRRPLPPSVPRAAGGGGTTCDPAPDHESPNKLSILRIHPCKVGGGATTEALAGGAAARRADMPDASGGGPTTEVGSPPPGRLPLGLTVGGGATTDVSPPASGERPRSVAESGTGGNAGEEGPRLGRDAVADFRSGGTTRRAARLAWCATCKGRGCAATGWGWVRTRVFGWLLARAE